MKDEKDEVTQVIENNSEILFIYEASRCNPNGDPDDENKPRMDYNRSINLVSDVRLKRYIRDYLADYKNKTIFVSKVGGETVDATNRLKKLIEENRNEINKDEKLKDLFDKDKPAEKNLSKHLLWLLSKLTDVRFFGATMPLKREGGKGDSITFTGPVQFNWGHSLNKVSGPMESSGITSTFSGAKADFGTMGKDYRVDYSILAFHGIVSATRAVYTNLTEEDMALLDDAMIHAVPLEATTRSKIGQTPLLYIRVEYNGKDFFLGDFRRYVKLVDNKGKELDFDATEKLRSMDEYKIDLSLLKEELLKIADKVKQVYMWAYNEDMVTGLQDKRGGSNNKIVSKDKNNNISISFLDSNPSQET